MATREELAAAWREGALWAAVECGAIRDEQAAWLVPGDNPYEPRDRYPDVEYADAIESDWRRRDVS